MEENIQELISPSLGPVDFVIITALEEERDAMLDKLSKSIKLDKEPSDVHTYYSAVVHSKRRDKSQYKVILTSLLDMGPLNATAQAVSVVGRWHPKYVLLVGIACGIKEEVALGDVLIATQVADYTLGKQESGKRAIRWIVFPSGASILDSANNVEGNWEKDIKEKRPNSEIIKRIKGVLASGGDVIKDDQVIAAYSESWPKLIGIEMESGGVAAGIHQTTDKPEFLMIKAVSDFGKNKHDPEVKPWRHYACHAAAAFALNVIKSGPSRSLSTIADTDFLKKKHTAAERRWRYIQAHPIKSLKILFLLKTSVSYDWLNELLMETVLSFGHKKKPFKLGQLLNTTCTPNNKEFAPNSKEPVYAYWELYKPELGYWIKKTDPAERQFNLVAGFEAVVPWSMLDVGKVNTLQDLALLADVGFSISPGAYQAGVEEFSLMFLGDTFSYDVKLSDTGTLDALHEFASKQYAFHQGNPPKPLGTSFSGIQLLEMFHQDTLPTEKKKRENELSSCIAGQSGPDGKAVSFYPHMPPNFHKSDKAKEYSFTISTPPEFDSDEEISSVMEMLKTDPTNTEHHEHLAVLYMQEGRLNDVEKCLQKAIDGGITSVGIHGLMAQTMGKLGRYKNALSHAQVAVQMSSKSAFAQTMLGSCLASIGRHNEALNNFKAAVHNDPNEASRYTNLGRAYMRINESSLAIESFRKALELNPEDADNHMYLGCLLENEGDDSHARGHLEKAVKINPLSHGAQANFGNHLSRHNEHEAAIKHLQKALEIKKDDCCYEWLGGSYAAIGNWKEAEHAFRKAIELNPLNASLLRNLGICLVNQGQLIEAKERIEDAIKIDPTDTIATTLLKKITENPPK